MYHVRDISKVKNYVLKQYGKCWSTLLVNDRAIKRKLYQMLKKGNKSLTLQEDSLSIQKWFFTITSAKEFYIKTGSSVW